MENPTRSKRSKTQVVQAVTLFEFRHREASQVSLAGSFSAWAPIPMVPLEPGHWVKQLTLPPGRHEYRLVVDGRWEDDPAATERVPNSYGGQSAVVIVPSPASGDQRGSSSGFLTSLPEGFAVPVRNQEVKAMDSVTGHQLSAPLIPH